MINEVWRINSYFKKNLKTSFFRTDSGAEVDLVIETPTGQVYGIEIKSATDVSPVDIGAGLSALQREVSLTRQVCVTQGIRPTQREGVDHLPWSNFFDWIKEL